MCERDHRYLSVRRTCGASYPVAIDCGDPLCVPCLKRWAKEASDRWWPVIKAMLRPMLMTPTIQDGADLRERIRYYAESMSRFLDIRLGARNRKKFFAEAIAFLISHFKKLVDAGKITSAEAESRIEDWKKSLTKFDKRLAKMDDHRGHGLRVRDIMGFGIALFEAPYKDSDWHVHRHFVIDAGFLPWPYLVILWKRATRGQGEVIDIRSVDKTDKSRREIFKYITKPWEIPAEKHGEFRDAVKGLKRIQPLGSAKPVEVVKPCPYCGEITCRVHLAKVGEQVEQLKVLGKEIFHMSGKSPIAWEVYWFRQERKWYECDPETVDLIHRELSCHSGTTSPPAIEIQPALIG